jgi:hypothetical protein
MHAQSHDNCLLAYSICLRWDSMMHLCALRALGVKLSKSPESNKQGFVANIRELQVKMIIVTLLQRCGVPGRRGGGGCFRGVWQR